MGVCEYIPTPAELEHEDSARYEAEAPPMRPMDDDEMERWMQWAGEE